MTKKRIVWAALALVLTSGLACRGPEGGQSRRPTQVVSDGLGRKVTVPVKVARAVSLAPNLTESVFAVGAGEALVGVTTYCNYPEAAKAIAKVGDTLNPNIETIIALKPDIVLVSTASQMEAFTQTLADNGIAVYVTNPSSISEVFTDLARLGKLFGTEEAARKEIEQLERLKAEVEDTVRGAPVRSVFIQISKEPLFTIGKGSFLNGLLESASSKSVTSDVESAFPKLSKETAAALNPDAIILSESDDNREPNEVFKDSPAVKNGRVYKINADILARPGPRLVDALAEIARDLHPERFK